MWVEIVDSETNKPKLINLKYVSCIFPDDDGIHFVMSDGCVLVSNNNKNPYNEICEILTKTSN